MDRYDERLCVCVAHDKNNFNIYNYIYQILRYYLSQLKHFIKLVYIKEYYDTHL